MGPSSFSYTDAKGRDWYLHTKEVTLRNGHQQTIYYFAKVEDINFACDMPDGYVVIETSRTGMPVLKKA